MAKLRDRWRKDPPRRRVAGHEQRLFCGPFSGRSALERPAATATQGALRPPALDKFSPGGRANAVRDKTQNYAGQAHAFYYRRGQSIVGSSVLRMSWRRGRSCGWRRGRVVVEIEIYFRHRARSFIGFEVRIVARKPAHARNQAVRKRGDKRVVVLHRVVVTATLNSDAVF